MPAEALKLEEGRILISAIKPATIPLLWDVVAPMLEKAIVHGNGETSLEIMLERFAEETMLLVVVHEGDEIIAAMTIEMRDFDTGKKVLVLSNCGGDRMHIWLQQVSDVMDELAKERGYDEIYLIGRPGWKRELVKHGYGLCHMVMSKKVGE